MSVPIPPNATPTGESIEFVAASEALRKLVAMAERVARSSAAVLICGETGTGKELIAAHVHRHSLRATQPLIEINCAAIPENLVESELFGYEKGAFSGADAPKPGMFELAENGTVFLDEIGELDLKVQAKLLRILDGAPYYRLGGNRKITTHARVIAATNRDLENGVATGAFRADLFHRIAQFQLHVPPLRDRRDDIVPLAQHFLAQAGYANSRFSSSALDFLHAYEWPGNARELRNTVLQAAIVADGGEILTEHLPVRMQQAREKPAEPAATREGATPGPAGDPAAPAGETMDDIERAAIQRALNACDDNRTAAAELLGISRRTLLRKLKAYRQEGTASGATLGRLSPQQHQSYRSEVDIPVSIRAGERSFSGLRIVNMSLGGIGVAGVKNAFDLVGNLDIRFELSGGPVSAIGAVQWSEPQGRVGIRFVSVAAESQQVMQQWLRQRQMEDGWSIQPPLAAGKVSPMN